MQGTTLTSGQILLGVFLIAVALCLVVWGMKRRREDDSRPAVPDQPTEDTGDAPDQGPDVETQDSGGGGKPTLPP